MKKRYATLIIFTGLLGLQGCAGPASLHVASLATIAATGKSVSDHALSAATEQDCSFFNLVQNESLCNFSNYSEISLLTNNQSIDDNSLIVFEYDETFTDPNTNAEQEVYLVLASFSTLENARNYQVQHDQWQTRIYPVTDRENKNNESRFRILMITDPDNNIESLKRTLVKAGITDTWFMAGQ